MRKLLCLVTLGALSAVAMPVGALGAATDPARDPARCAARGAQILVAGLGGNIYAAPGRIDEGRGVEVTRVYACSYAIGRPRLLGVDEEVGDEQDSPTSFRELRALTLSDTAATAVRLTCASGACAARIEVRSLRTGRLVRSANAGSRFDPLALSGSDVAYVTTGPGGGCESGCEVHLVNTSGDRVLDSGTAIDPRSFGLELNANHGASVEIPGVPTFTWVNGGTARQARFSG
jgi:hypothetical protein